MALVCLCRGVSDRAVRHAVKGGAQTVDAVGAVCRAGTSCAGCHEFIDELIAEGLGVRRPGEVAA